MWRPYYDHKNIIVLLTTDNREVRELKAGEFADLRFTTKVPMNRPKNATLFIVGYVKYKDAFGNIRATNFARRYDPAKRYFVLAEGDRDYERED
jgi:hypothetical protein